MKNKLIILIFSLSLMAFVSVVLQAKEADKQQKGEVITTYVKGLVCDFCATGLNKTFKKQKAVDSINVDFKKSFVKIFLKANKKLSDKKINKLIKGNGFDVVSIERSPKK